MRRADAFGLHDLEGFAGLDRTELALVADEGEAVDLEQVSQADKLVDLVVTRHRRFIDEDDAALEHGAGGVDALDERLRFEQSLVGVEELGDCDRLDAGIALEIAHQLVLRPDGDDVATLATGNLCNDAERRALARAGDALHGDDAVPTCQD